MPGPQTQHKGTVFFFFFRDIDVVCSTLYVYKNPERRISHNHTQFSKVFANIRRCVTRHMEHVLSTVIRTIRQNLHLKSQLPFNEEPERENGAREKRRIRLRSGPEPLWLRMQADEGNKAARHPANRGPHLAHDVDDRLMMRVASTRQPRGAQITQMHISAMRSARR